ncbi:MAG TPA: arabinan endo-1,5-alpha-L-arabinosidase [Terriglobia bacterium]
MRSFAAKLTQVATVGVLFANLSVPGPASDASPHLTGDLSCHDPHIASENSKYYLFCTSAEGRNGFLPIRCSSDLKHWSLCGTVFEEPPAWIHEEIPESKGAWAPDLARFGSKWHLYYAISTFGKNRSLIGHATNATLDSTRKDYRWTDEGKVIESFPTDDWNAIDPNVIVSSQNWVWMDFGSFWSGIKMVRLDPATGERSAEDTHLYSLAQRPRDSPILGSIEGPYIFHHAGFYYLFASFDFCCRGAASTYNIRVGRSRQVMGPYADRDEKAMLEGGGTMIQQGSNEWRGPGHNSVLHDHSGDYIFFHAYKADTGRPFLQIGKIEWVGGWPKIVSLWRPEASNSPSVHEP